MTERRRSSGNPPAVRTETGTLPGEFPYARVGNGPRTLAVFPGFGDAMFDGEYPAFTGWALAPYVARYLDEYAVYLVSRPRGLPAGYDAAGAADDHADALEPALGRSAADGTLDVIGISMGGLIGQELARRHPDLVDRFVLANSGCRLAPEARPDVREFERDACERDWAAIRSKLARALYSDARAITYPPWIRTVGRFVLPRPANPADVWRSLELILDFDGRDELPEIEQRSLVFGGDRDPYFTPAVARETATGMPNAELRLVSGAKHGAFHERKATFDSTVTEFLERS